MHFNQSPTGGVLNLANNRVRVCMYVCTRYCVQTRLYLHVKCYTHATEWIFFLAGGGTFAKSGIYIYGGVLENRRIQDDTTTTTLVRCFVRRE